MSATATRPRYTDADRARVAELAAAGLGCKRIGAKLGIPYSTVFRWLHPDYAERSRRRSNAAKKRRTGACRNCGAETRYNGHSESPTHPNGASLLCPDCSTEANRVWTRAAVVEAFREFHARHGRTPASTDSHALAPSIRVKLSEERVAEAIRGKATPLPVPATVAALFGSWRAAVEAAGLPLLPTGRSSHRVDRYRTVLAREATILRAVSGGCRTIAEISAATGFQSASLWRSLNRMVERGELVCIRGAAGRGRPGVYSTGGKK